MAEQSAKKRLVYNASSSNNMNYSVIQLASMEYQTKVRYYNVHCIVLIQFNKV